MADVKEKSKEKATKAQKAPKADKPPQSSKAPQGDVNTKSGNKGEAKADTKAAPAAGAKVLPGAPKGGELSKEAVKQDPKTQKRDSKTQKMEAADRKESKKMKTPLQKDEKESKTIHPLVQESDEAIEVREFIPEEGKAYMLDAQGKVMLDEEGNPYPQLNMWDIEGNIIHTKKGNLIPGRFQFNEEGNVFLGAEGYPFLERQETTEEKHNRLEREARWKKLQALREKVEAEREMMGTPLPKKPVKWQKYTNAMYLPRSLKTVIYKDRGRPGDDWRNYVKKYTLKEMNHKLTYQLPGRAGILWRKLHTHITYLQNPRHASEHPKHFKALRIFRLEDTPKGLDWVLLDPPVAYFDGFGELASTTI